jgi:hypothetical protein
MRIQLDPRTLVVIAVFVALVPTAIAALVWRTRRTYPGFGRWTLGNLLGTLCLALLSMRGVAPDWISIVLANASALGAAVLFFQGIRKFRGLRLLWWPECLTAILGLAAVIYFRFVSDAISVRTVAWSVALGGFSLACGITLLREMPSGHRFSMTLTGIVFMMYGVVHLLRGFYNYMYAPNPSLFAPSAINAMLFAGAGLGAVGWTFGFIMMTGERLLLDAKPTPEASTPAVPARGLGAKPLTGPVPEAEVRQQVERIAASDVFRRSGRMERFLSLAVERALLGQPEKLKEYALGRDVFNRGDDYDPRADSIVRVEAQRLRRKLREYYESYGRNDLVIVEFPSGSYVPLFRYRELEVTSLPRSFPNSSNR